MKYLRLICLTALITGVCAQGAWTQKPDALPLEKLALPKSLGKIEDRFQGTGPYWIVQIQDVHAHAAAQENIAAILDHLNSAYGIEKVGVEGGWGETRFAKSWGLPSSREKQMLARALLEEEFLTGAGYAGLFSQSPLDLIGIEDQMLYEKNRQAYLAHLPGREAALEKIDTEEKNLLARKGETFNVRLLAFDKALYEFTSSHKADTFLPLVLDEAASLGLARADLDQIELFKRILDKEKQLDEEKLKAEAARLQKEFQKPHLGFEELLRHIIPAEKLEHYPASRAYLEILDLQDVLSYRVFFMQLQQLTGEIQQKLYESDAERLLDQEWNSFLLLKKMLTFTATPEIFARFKTESQSVQERAAALDLAEALEHSLLFYRLAEKRDYVFFEKLQQTPKLQDNIALVTGGFHTEGLSNELRKAGISYIVISPDLGDQPPDEELYIKRLVESPAGTQTLAHIQNRFFTRDFDEGFAAGILFLKTERNVFKAVDVVLNHTAKEIPAVLPDAEPLTWEAWQEFTGEEKIGYLKAALRKEAEATPQRMLLIATAKDFDNLLQNPEAQRLWPHVRDDRMNVIGLLHEDPSEIPAEAETGAFRLLRIPGNDIKAFIASEKFQERFSVPLEKQEIAVLTDASEDIEDSRILGLPRDNAVSLLFRLYLSTPALRELAKNKLFQDNLSEILRSIKQLDAFLTAA